MPTLLWLLAFCGVQVALVIAASRALAVMRPLPKPSWKSSFLRWGLVLLVFLGFVALSLPVGHGPNYESRVIGHLRQFSSNQETFRVESGGVYAPPDCLVDLRRCIPGYAGPQIGAPTDPAALQQSLQYGLTFHPGPAATSPTGAHGLESWAYVAEPATRQTRGRRPFCLDSRGVLAFAEPGQPIVLSKAECPSTLSPVR